MLKTEAADRGFQHLPGDLANVNILENNGWSLLLHKVDGIFVKIWEKIWHNILSPFGSQRVGAHFLKRFKMAAIFQFDLGVSKMKTQGSCCTTAVVHHEIQIHQHKRRTAYLHIQ